MPTQPVTLAWAGGRVVVDAQAGIELATDSGQSVQLSLGPGARLDPVLTDEDACEHEGTVGDLTVSQRVSVGEHCQLRWVVAVPAQQSRPFREAPPARFELDIRLSEGQAGWVWPSGADGFFAVLPTTAAGPVLVVSALQAELRVGEPDGDSTLRLIAAPDPLAPGERYVVILRASVVPSLTAAGALLPAWYESLTVEEGEEWEAPLADLGLAVDPAVEVRYPDDEAVVRLSAPPGRHQVHVHGRRGITDLTLEVAPAMVAEVGRLAERLLAQGRLDAAGAVLVHRALESGVLARTPAAEDALDRFDWSLHAEPLAIAFGSERALADNEREMAREAVRQVGSLPSVPGVARVRSLVWLAASTLGVDPGELDLPVQPGQAGLETSLMLGRRSDWVSASLAASINRLGAGLPGFPVGLSATDEALLVGLLESCPEGWPEAPLAAFTAQTARRRLLARYAAGELVDATPMAWLLVFG